MTDEIYMQRCLELAILGIGNVSPNPMVGCVIVHENKEIVLKAKLFVEKWLSAVGLELKESKTRISHTLETIEGAKPGFDFLGYTIRQFSVSCNRQGYKLLIKPSRLSQKRRQYFLD